MSEPRVAAIGGSVAALKQGKHMQRTMDLTLAVLACVAAFWLSWPFWRNFEYWPESHVAWWAYFALGFVLSVGVFYLFIGSLHILFQHGREESAAAAIGKGERS